MTTSSFTSIGAVSSFQRKYSIPALTASWARAGDAASMAAASAKTARICLKSRSFAEWTGTSGVRAAGAARRRIGGAAAGAGARAQRPMLLLEDPDGELLSRLLGQP